MGSGNFDGAKGRPIVKYGDTDVVCAKTAEPIEMPFGLWVWMGRRNRVLDEDPDPSWQGAILGDRGAHLVYGLCAISYAITDEPIDFPFGLLTLVGRRKQKFIRIRQMAPMCTSSVVFAKFRQFARRQSTVGCAKTCEPIDLSFGLWTRVGQRKHKFNRIRQMVPMCPHRRQHWRHLANTIERSVCMRRRCGRMSNYFDHMLLLSSLLSLLPLVMTQHYTSALKWTVLRSCNVLSYVSKIFIPTVVTISHIIYGDIRVVFTFEMT